MNLFYGPLFKIPCLRISRDLLTSLGCSLRVHIRGPEVVSRLLWLSRRFRTLQLHKAFWESSCTLAGIKSAKIDSGQKVPIAEILIKNYVSHLILIHKIVFSNLHVVCKLTFSSSKLVSKYFLTDLLYFIASLTVFVII